MREREAEKINNWYLILGGFPGGSNSKESAAMRETLVLSLGREDPLEKGNGYPLQYSGLENSLDRGAWCAIAHGAAKSQT